MYSHELQRLYDHIVNLNPRSDFTRIKRALDLFIVAIECIEDGNDERFLHHVRALMDAEMRNE